MARRIPISLVSSSGANPGTFTIGTTPDNSSGNWTSVFQGKFYRQATSPFAQQAFWTSPLAAPSGFSLIEATQFEVGGNASYAGRYTVFTQASVAGLASADLVGAQTIIRVNEAVPAPLSPGHSTSGYITNVSTYYIVRQAGAAPVIVPPGVTIDADNLEYVGRNFSGWGEIFNQNYAELVQNFASSTAPTAASTGMLWFDTTVGLLKIYNGTWQTINAAAFAPVNSFRHTQGAAAATWTINHALGTTAPFIVHHTFYVDTGGGVIKPIIPSDVTYVSANTVTVTFTAPYSGYALIRL